MSVAIGDKVWISDPQEAWYGENAVIVEVESDLTYLKVQLTDWVDFNNNHEVLWVAAGSVERVY